MQIWDTLHGQRDRPFRMLLAQTNIWFIGKAAWVQATDTECQYQQQGRNKSMMFPLFQGEVRI
jgi:hypothetical protein